MTYFHGGFEWDDVNQVNETLSEHLVPFGWFATGTSDRILPTPTR